MIVLSFLFSIVFSQVVTSDFNTPFTSTKESYRVQQKPSAETFKNLNELFDRKQCKTCCRVIFVSDHNFKTDKQFTSEDDKRGDTRYAMDMEFDDISGVRETTGDYEQCILLRPLDMSNHLQHFELNAYKMINMFSAPQRVHDIRSGISKGNKLIIWKKKSPLLASTNNQRFTYLFPYQKQYYDKMDSVYTDYKKHFYAPYYTTEKVCYEAHTGTKQTWTGNKKLTVLGTSYQIKIESCKDDSKQLFVPVYV